MQQGVGQCGEALTKNNILAFLQGFVFKEHFEKIHSQLRNYPENDPIWQGINATQIIGQIMRKCNGALDVYGPEQYLGQYFDVYLSNKTEEGRFQDSQLTQYFAKNVFLDHAAQAGLKISMRWGIERIADLLFESFNNKIERQLAGSYEIINTGCFEKMTQNMMACCNQPWADVKATMKRCSREADVWAENPFLVFGKFSQLFNPEHDQKLLVELQLCLMEYQNSANSSRFQFLYATFSQLVGVKDCLLSIMEANKHVFIPFWKSEKVLGSRFPVDTPVIRQIHFDDEKVLFVKDVKNAIERALKNTTQESRILEDLLKVETVEERRNGLCFTISLAEYLKILKVMSISADRIVLVDERCSRAPHVTTPIFSPYGKLCKPAVDVFNELLSTLPIVLRVWQRIEPEHLRELEAQFAKVCERFMDHTKCLYFVDCDRIDLLGQSLRDAMKPLIEKTPFPVNSTRVFESPAEKLTLALFRVGAEKLRLTRLYPEINKYFLFFYGKHRNFFPKTCISQLELTVMVQDCLARCLVERIPSIGLFVCSQKRCLQYGLSECSCFTASHLSPEDRGSYTSAVITEENDYAMKFDYFGNQNCTFGSLVKKSGNQQLVLNSMAPAFIVNEIQKQIEPKYRHIFIGCHMCNYVNVWKALKCTTFYMTFEELKHLSDDVVRKFTTQYTSDMFQKIKTSLPIYETSLLTQLAISVIDQSLTYAVNVLRNSETFERYLPKRIVYLSLSRHQCSKTNSMELYVEAGEFLSALKAKLQLKHFAETRESWDVYNRLMIAWQREDGFTKVRAEDAIRSLIEFPVNPGEFRFAPSVDCVFRNFTRKVSDVIAAVYAENQHQNDTEKEKNWDNGSGMQGIIDAVKRMGSELAKQTEDLRDAKSKLSSYENAKSEEVLTMKTRLEQADKTFEKKLKEQEKQLKSVQRNLDELKIEAKQNIEKKDKQLKAQEASMKNTVSKYEMEMKQMNTILKSKDVEVEKLKKEIASSPKYDRKIELLETKIRQLNVEKEDQIKRLTDNHNILCQTIRTDLARRTGEKVILERQLAEKVAKIAQLERQKAGEAGGLASQRVDQLIGENQCLQSKLRLEQIKHDAVQRQNADLLKHIEEMEGMLATRSSASLAPTLFTLPPEGPSTSGNSPSTPSSVPTSSNPSPILAVSVAPTTTECGICFNEMRKNGRTTKCDVCKTQWHSACINKWTLTNPTCPICRRSFPNPRQFPPLRRN